jgi:hypothetical protein
MLQNVTKSDEGWRRFRERTNSGAHARGPMMDHRVQSALSNPNPTLRFPVYEGDEQPRRRRKRRRVAPNGRTF